MAIEALEDAQKSLDGQFSCGNCYTNVIQACKEALEQPSVAQLNDEYLRDTHVDGLEQPAQEPVAWMKNALDNARDVCKYLDHDMIKEAKAHTKFFWNDLDKIRDFDDTHPAPSWQSLSDDEIQALALDNDVISVISQVEQALRNKNEH